jgi:hypothetical protein
MDVWVYRVLCHWNRGRYNKCQDKNNGYYKFNKKYLLYKELGGEMFRIE